MHREWRWCWTGPCQRVVTARAHERSCRRHAGGGQHAAVTIRSGNDPVELIAHELEHVLEQLDGVDLRSLAAVPASQVRGCECGEERYETVRAVRAGRAAAEEVRQHGR